MKKLLLFSIALIITISSCNWFRETPEIGLILQKHFNNKLYNDFDTVDYNPVFLAHLDSIGKQLGNQKVLKAFYNNHQSNPEWIAKFYASGDLGTLKKYISQSNTHGYSPELFNLKKLDSLLSRLDANNFKSIKEVYPIIAELELTAAASGVKYHNFIYYGSTNPRRLFTRYYIPVKKADSAGTMKVLETVDLARLLEDIQPKSDTYTILQSNLINYLQQPEKNQQVIKTVLVNMERQRWKLPELGDEYVEVNIPDFTVTWFNKADTLSHMNVCVGGKREDDYAAKIAQYLKTKNLDDKPKNHETPILYSKFNAIQVNPIWNIPVSIARSEIYYQALKDPYYLSNNNIKVYYKGKEIRDPDTIQWNRYPREKLPFQFKQGSGEGNALGKFKFIFDNNSSVYLHDTNNKTAFKYTNRAISHGCVRVERPLEFAENLIKDKYENDLLRMEVNLPPIDTTKMELYKKKLAKKTDTTNIFQLKPKWFGLKKQIPILINYKTAWVENGKIEFRPDVYSLDETLWVAMKKFM